MVAGKCGRRSTIAKKASNALPRKIRLQALEKARQIRPFIEISNRPENFAQFFKELVPSSFNEVAARVARPVAPPDTWSHEEIEDYAEAMKRVEEEIRKERNELDDEQRLIEGLLRGLARHLRKPGASPVLRPPVELPASEGQRMQLVFDSLNRIRVEPVFPKIAALRSAFCEALNGLDASRIRECPVCKKHPKHLYWADRYDKPTCGGGCSNRLRSQRHYEKTVKPNREQARRLCDAGKSFAEIARELSLSMRKVRQYLVGRKTSAVIRLKHEQKAKERKG